MICFDWREAITLKLSDSASRMISTTEKSAIVTSRTPRALASSSSRSGEGGAGEHREAHHEPDDAVPLEEPVAPDQVEDQQHEEHREDRRDDAGLRGQPDDGFGRRQEPAHFSASGAGVRGRIWPTSRTISVLKM